MSNEELIKVHLPGESIWAAMTGKTEDGRIKAELRNGSFHGIPWGTAVVLGHDTDEIVEPVWVIEKAKQAVESFRLKNA